MSAMIILHNTPSPQSERQQRANTFQFDLTFNNTGDCVEFPANADPILAVIYQLRGLSSSQGDPEPNQLQVEQEIIS